MFVNLRYYTHNTLKPLSYLGLKSFRIKLKYLALLPAFHLLSACDDNLTISGTFPPCEQKCPTISKIEPIAALPGEKITISGANFMTGMQVAIGDNLTSVELASDSEAKMIVPEGPAGEVTAIAVLEEKRTEGVSFYRLSEDYPLFTADPKILCEGVKFYNQKGELSEGTKNCSPDLTGLDPDKIIAGHSIGGIEGRLPYCDDEGQQGCVNDGAFKSADTERLAEKIIEGQSVAGVLGTVTLPDPSVVGNGFTYGVPGSQYTGSATTEAHIDCNADGATGCVATSSFKAADIAGLEDKILLGQTVAGVSGNIALPSAADVQSGVEYGINGASLTGSFMVPSEADVATGVSYGHAAEFTGSAIIESHSNCVAAGATGCIATATYKTMDLSNNNEGGALDLNQTDFNTRIASDSLFEYWDENGMRYTANGSSKLAATNIRKDEIIFNVTGTLLETPGECASNGDQSCVATGSYFAATSCTANSSNCYLPLYQQDTQPLKALDYDDIKANEASIRSTYTIADIQGTLADCAAAGDTACYAGEGFPVIKSSDATDATNLTSTNFDETIKTAGAFEFWGADGTRYQVDGDADLSAANIKKDV